MTETNQFTEADVARIAESAADRAIHNLLMKLDIDATKPEQIIRFRENLNFLDEQRQGQEILRQNMKKGALYLAGTAALGFVYLMWDALKIGLSQMFVR